MSLALMRLRVKQTKGMFPTESLVVIPTTSGPIELFVDNVHLVGDEMRVEVVDKDETQALVRLPAEPIWGGRNVVVLVSDLAE